MDVKRNYPVFVTDEGDHFVFPGLFDSPDENRFLSTRDVLLWTMTLGVSLAPDQLVVDFPDGVEEVRVPNVRVQMPHQAFANGTELILVISGPLFDEKFASGTSE